MKRIIYLLSILIFSFSTIYAQQKRAVLSVKESTFDFGEIKEKDGKVSHTFIVENKGDSPLILTRVIASCGCTTPEWPKEPIAAGKTANVKITYNPANRPGVFAKSISIYSNGKRGSYILTIKGKVK